MARQRPGNQGNPWLSGIRWHDVVDENEDEAAVSGIEGVPGVDLTSGGPPTTPPGVPITEGIQADDDPYTAAMRKAIEAFTLEPGYDELTLAQAPKYVGARLKNIDPITAYSIAVGNQSSPVTEGFMGSKVPMSLLDQQANQLGGQAALITYLDNIGWSDSRVKGALAGNATYIPSYDQVEALQRPLEPPPRMGPQEWGGFIGSEDPSSIQPAVGQPAPAGQPAGFWSQPSRPPGVTRAGANALFPQMGAPSGGAPVTPNLWGNNIQTRQFGGGNNRPSLDTLSPTRTWVANQQAAADMSSVGSRRNAPWAAAAQRAGAAPAAAARVANPFIMNPGAAAMSYFDYAVGSKMAPTDTPVISTNAPGKVTTIPGRLGYGTGMGSITGGGGGGGGMTAAQAEQAKLDWARLAQDKAISDAQIAAQRRAAAMQLAAQAAQVQSQNWQTGLPVTLPKGTMYAPGMEYGGPANVLSDIAGASYSPQQLAVSNPPNVQSLIDRMIGRYG